MGEADETYLKFISSLPYERYIESEELITQKCLAKSKAKKAEKIMTYLKRSQIKRKKSNEKFLALKMKTIAEKAMQSGRGYVKFDYK